MPKSLKLVILSLLFSNLAVAQAGRLKILVVDANDKTPVVYVPIKIEKEDSQSKSNIDSAYTDDNGRVVIILADTGKYTIKAAYPEYYDFELKGVIIKKDTTVSLKIKMKQISYHKTTIVY